VPGTATPSAIHSTTFQLLVVFLLVGFSSCLTPRKMDKRIDSHYGSTVPAKVKSNDFITIKTDGMTRSDKVSTTQKGKSKLLPAVVYWQWQYSTVSTLNPFIPAGQFSADVLPYANAKGLRQKLNGQKVELTIESAPAVFSLMEKGHLVYLLVYYIGWEYIYIDPNKTDLVVSYRVLNGDTETKKGVINITNRDQPIALKMFQSTKKMTWRYLDQYSNNIKAMSKELIDKLIVELQQGKGVVQTGAVQ
jgi:hypothetical protein